MKFVIYPHKGLGDLNFGMSRVEVRNILSSDCESYKDFSNDEDDYYPNLLTHVYYKNNKFEAIEARRNKIEIVYRDYSIMEESFSKIKKMLMKEGSFVEFDNLRFTSLDLGVGIYSPVADEDQDSNIESVIVFRKGYYDDTINELIDMGMAPVMG